MTALIEAAERECEFARERYLATWEAAKSWHEAGDSVRADECRRVSQALFPLLDGMELMVQHMKRLAAKSE